MPSNDVMRKNIEIGTRIMRRREELGMTQEELANRVGYVSASSRSTIQKIESGRTGIRQSKIVAFAEALNTSIQYLMGWEDVQITEDTVNFQVIGDIAAGYGGEAIEGFTGEIVKIPAEWLRGRRPTDSFLLRVKGDSMYPAYQDGDFILVRKQTTLNHSGQVGVIMYEDNNATLKKVEYIYGEDWMKLIPINPNYPPVLVKDEALEHCHVLGYPVKLIREIEQ